ncbi:uncharacterized protein LOC116693368 isoform X1 [Etheostoma spectabile]|uniref:uncharacterized protein LOC116693368 isoform X1 n=1 Tax=Etheostoma spectabile TaxID=54343 RepID=UPI0013AEF39F|nr:uncharacterized protein LOC116693368 isoform X1 [Etheostoma spectabile]
MELKWPVRDRISLVLLILVTISTGLYGQNLDCTNDYDSLVFCHFEAQNCSEYKLTFLSTSGDGEKHSNFTQCHTAQCCSVHNEILVIGESFLAKVWKGDDIMETKTINIRDSIKPKTPTIVSVNESNGNFHVKWKKNVKKSLRDNLTANVTYHKKGGAKTVSALVKPTPDEFSRYEILGQDLEPSTTYVVSVKSHIDLSEHVSDSSEEWEFTTPMSSTVLALAIIISLSFAAIILSAAVNSCYVKLNTKWRDTVAKCPNPKLLIMHPGKEEVLKPVPPIISSVCVEPLVPDDSKSWSKGSLGDTSSGSLQQSSGISTGSSGFSYANTEPCNVKASIREALLKALPNISPISHLITNPFTELNQDSGLLSSSYNPCGVRADDMSFGSSGFENKTYSILIPSGPHQNLTDSSEFQTHAEMLCDSPYHPIVGDVTCVDQHAPACPRVNFPPVVLSPMPTDMSYQQSNANSGGFSYAEDSSLSSVSSGTNTIAVCDPVSRVEGRLESFDEAACGATKLHGKTEGAIICDENPCYGIASAGSHSFPPVDDGYQAFQNLVEQPDTLFSEEKFLKKEERWNRYPEESFTKLPQSFLSPVVPGFINNVQGGQCLSEFLSLIPAHQSMPLITDSGYHSV